MKGKIPLTTFTSVSSCVRRCVGRFLRLGGLLQLPFLEGHVRDGHVPEGQDVLHRRGRLPGILYSEQRTFRGAVFGPPHIKKACVEELYCIFQIGSLHIKTHMGRGGNMHAQRMPRTYTKKSRRPG